jgi:PhnB protein
MADELNDPTLATIAAALAGCPGAGFKARLRRRLEGSIEAMTTTPAPVASAATRSFTPYVMAQDIEPLIAFATRVFGAEEVRRGTGSAGGVHCELRIGDTTLMFGGATPGEPVAPRLAGLHVYVDDVDAVYARALAEGARSLGAPADRHYGERAGFVADMAGNHWYIATRTAPAYFANPRTVTVNLYVHRTAERTGSGFIAFLETAFGAQVELRVDRGEMIGHAVLRLGETALELGEGAEPGIAAPAALVLNADDADAMYAQALAAGAASIFPPAAQPWGARMGAVRDPWGNEWYIAAP